MNMPGNAGHLARVGGRPIRNPQANVSARISALEQDLTVEEGEIRVEAAVKQSAHVCAVDADDLMRARRRPSCRAANNT
jgi:hypothetical protein